MNRFRPDMTISSLRLTCPLLRGRSDRDECAPAFGQHLNRVAAAQHRELRRLQRVNRVTRLRELPMKCHRQLFGRTIVDVPLARNHKRDATAEERPRDARRHLHRVTPCRRRCCRLRARPRASSETGPSRFRARTGIARLRRHRRRPAARAAGTQDSLSRDRRNAQRRNQAPSSETDPWSPSRRPVPRRRA